MLSLLSVLIGLQLQGIFVFLLLVEKLLVLPVDCLQLCDVAELGLRQLCIVLPLTLKLEDPLVTSCVHHLGLNISDFLLQEGCSFPLFRQLILV